MSSIPFVAFQWRYMWTSRLQVHAFAPEAYHSSGVVGKRRGACIDTESKTLLGCICMHSHMVGLRQRLTALCANPCNETSQKTARWQHKSRPAMRRSLRWETNSSSHLNGNTVAQIHASPRSPTSFPKWWETKWMGKHIRSVAKHTITKSIMAQEKHYANRRRKLRFSLR